MYRWETDVREAFRNDDNQALKRRIDAALTERGRVAGQSVSQDADTRAYPVKGGASPRSVSATLTDRGADDPAPRLERSLPGSDAPASPRAPRSVNVTRSADSRVGFVTWLVFAAVLFELAYRITWGS